MLYVIENLMLHQVNRGMLLCYTCTVLSMVVFKVDSGASFHKIRLATEPHYTERNFPTSSTVNVPPGVVTARRSPGLRHNPTLSSNFDSDIEKLLSRYKNCLTKDEQDEIGSVTLEGLTGPQRKSRRNKSNKALLRLGGIDPFVADMKE